MSSFVKGIEPINLALVILILILVFNPLKLVVMEVFPPLHVEIDAQRDTECDGERYRSVDPDLQSSIRTVKRRSWRFLACTSRKLDNRSCHFLFDVVVKRMKGLDRGIKRLAPKIEPPVDEYP